MGFGPKLKTVSKCASANALYRNDAATFGQLVNKDPVLIMQNQAMVVILGAIKAKFVGGGTNTIQAPPPFPVPKARWFGELSMDTTTPGTNSKGKKVYTYDHLKAMEANANTFRGRVDDIIKYTSMEDDLTNSTANPNPGGQAGVHGKLPVAPGLTAPKKAA